MIFKKNLFVLNTGGNVSELSVPDQLEAQVLFVEAKHIQTMQTEQIKAHEEAKQALQKEIRAHEQLKLQFEQDKKLHDDLQNQLDILTLEKATLQADKSNLRKRILHLHLNVFLE